jgi:ubiquinone/menaquinone biosynthesis C-methylase UbiE
MNISKDELLSYLKQPFVYDLVFKVLNYNFEDNLLTTQFLILLKAHFLSDDKEPITLQNFLSENKIGLCQEQGRVDGKIFDLTQIIDTELSHKPTSILDIGVGNGNIITSVANKVGLDKKDLFGIDVIDYSKNNNFNFVKYENGKIPLADESIDLVMLMMVLHHTNDPIDTLKEAHRVLSRNGSVIVRETNAYQPELVSFNILMEYVFYTILLEIPIDITHNYFNSQKWESLFSQAGFQFEKLSEKNLDENPFTGMYYLLTKY